jgi:hypothetical protein
MPACWKAARRSEWGVRGFSTKSRPKMPHNRRIWETSPYARVLEGSEEVRVGGQRVFHEIEAENAA